MGISSPSPELGTSTRIEPGGTRGPIETTRSSRRNRARVSKGLRHGTRPRLRLPRHLPLRRLVGPVRLEDIPDPGEPLFRSLVLYLVSFNLLVFGFLVARYAHTNLVGDDPTGYAPVFWAVTAVGAFVLEAGIVWTILRLGHALRREPSSDVITRIFVAVTAVIGIGYIVGIVLVYRDRSIRWLVDTHMVMSLFVGVGIVYTLFGLIAGRAPNLDAAQRGSVRRLGWLLLGGVLVMPISLVLPSDGYLAGIAAGLLWLSIAPLLWLRLYAGPFHSARTTGNAAAAMDALARRHDITRREREIMALIVAGQSNKEIEDRLCISFSTVKNHVYNLYRKLGVNSRTQLTHLVMIEGDRLEIRSE